MRRFALAVLLAATSSFAQTPLWNGLLAPSRATNWQLAGVNYGAGNSAATLPSASWTQCTNAACNTVTAAGTSVTASQIQTAIMGAPANTYVLLAPGTYNLTSGICVNGANNVELRGSGANSTFLVFTGNSVCSHGATEALLGFQASDGTYGGGVGVGSVTRWTAASQGATSIVFPNGLGPIQINTTSSSNPTVLVLDQCDDQYSGNTTGNQPGGTCGTGSSTDNGNWFACSDFYHTGPPATGCDFNSADASFSRNFRLTAELVRVTSCVPGCNATGSVTVNLDHPLIHANWNAARSPEAWSFQPSNFVGFRNLSIDGSAVHVIPHTLNIASISMNNVYNAWVENVRMIHSPGLGIWVWGVAHSSFLDNYVADTGQAMTCNGGNPPGGDNSSCDPFGIKDSLGESNLFQNNIVQSSRACITNGEGPAVGDVTAYNLCINAYAATDYMFPGLWMHSEGDDYNLFEGNVADEINGDDVHGTHNAITAFRNLFTGWESCANGNCMFNGSNNIKDAGLQAVQNLAYNRYWNVVDNVLGNGIPFGQGSNYQYMFTNNEYFTFNINAVYNLGSGNQADGANIPLDPLTVSSAMIWGNWDNFTGSTMLCTGAGTPVATCPADERGSAGIPFAPALSSPPTTFSSYPSLYLSGRPSWWPSSIAYPAIGSDVTGGNLGQCTGTLNVLGKVAGAPAMNSSQCAGGTFTSSYLGGHGNAIPALSCYLNVMGGPPDGVLGGAATGVGPMLAYDISMCSGSSPGQAPAPVITPATGTYATTQTVSITCSAPTPAIYFTTDNTTPTPIPGELYSTSFPISSTSTVQAVCTSPGLTTSNVAQSILTITNPVLASPTLSPQGSPATDGYFLTLPTVTVACSAGATSCTTTDGSSPSTTSSSPAFVQAVALNGSGTTGFPSITIPGVTAGNALIVTVFDGGGVSRTDNFVDTQGNSWSTLAKASLPIDHDTISIGCAIAGSSGSDTITFQTLGSPANMTGVVYEFSGTTCNIDGSAVSRYSASATACDSGPLTTTAANDVLIGMCGLQNGQTAITAGSGWSNGKTYSGYLGSSSSLEGIAEEKIAASAGTYTATSGTFGTASEESTIAIAFLSSPSAGTCSHGSSSASFPLSTSPTTVKSLCTKVAAQNSPTVSQSYTQTQIIRDASSAYAGSPVGVSTASCPPIVVSAGDCITAEVSGVAGVSIASVADNVNAGNYLVALPLSVQNDFGQNSAVYYKSSSAGGTVTVTANWAAATGHPGLACQAWKPSTPNNCIVDTPFSRNLTNQPASPSANPTSSASTVTPTNSNTAVICTLINNGQVPTAGTGFNLLPVTSLNSGQMAEEYQVQTTATGVNCPFTSSAGFWLDEALGIHFGAVVPPAATGLSGLFITGSTVH